jgi:GTP cyclohydrolase I
MYEKIKPLMDKVIQELVPASPDNEKTGERYSRFLSDFLSPTVPELTTFESPATNMILVRDVEIYSLCEHHLLPIIGRAFVAYFPQGKILGLSKIPRIVQYYSHRLQNQERLTTEIMDAMVSAVNPRGVAVMTKARHLCMEMRGVCSAAHTEVWRYCGDCDTHEFRMEFQHLLQGVSA